MNTSVDDQIALLSRGATELISAEELRKKIARGKPLRIKLGLDPTAPDLHLGHTVVLEKLRQFQELGHQVIFLIGDYTATIGDPTGRSATRPALSAEEIAHNVKTYTDQAFKILDRNKTEVVYNADWLGKMDGSDMIKLAAQYTLARMLEREDFKKRFESNQSLCLHEFFYPLLQGQDSVELKADVELGGTDQKFNLLMGRMLQERAGQEPQAVLMMPLLVGTDGEKKMSKSYGNHIGIHDAPIDMFGKIMSISDELMWDYYTLLSHEDAATIEARKLEHPKQAKVALAQELIARYHSHDAAQQAAAEFEQVFAQKGKPTDIPETTLASRPEGYLLVDVLAELAMVKSKGEARRLIAQNGVRVNDVVVDDAQLALSDVGEYVLQVGKRRFHKALLVE